MKQATREWVKKAEEDYLAALDLARRRKVLLHNSVCFHCEQTFPRLAARSNLKDENSAPLLVVAFESVLDSDP
jgi:hypothetical protein